MGRGAWSVERGRGAWEYAVHSTQNSIFSRLRLSLLSPFFILHPSSFILPLMSTLEVTVSCPIYDSFRVRQVAGMFDVPIHKRATERFRVEVPSWARRGVGLIVGPSGSGKSTLAATDLWRALWRATRGRGSGSDRLPGRSADQGDHGPVYRRGVRLAAQLDQAYQVLSTGEQFRCDLARALAFPMSPFRRRTARATASRCCRRRCRWWPSTSSPASSIATLPGSPRRRLPRDPQGDDRRPICRRDVPLRRDRMAQPDWVIDMATSEFSRRCLQRPSIQLQLVRCQRRAWQMFARHHYLSGSLAPTARCFLVLWDDVPVAFCATVALIGHKGRWRVSRLVTLPDYQGLGIGMSVLEAVAEVHREEGHRVNVTASHRLIAHCRASPKWRA